METAIYEGRANELNERITYLMGLLDSYDPVNEADSYQKVLEELETLKEMESSNASTLRDAEQVKQDEIKLEAQLAEMTAEAKEKKRWFERIDPNTVLTVAGTLLGIGLIERFERDPEGGFFPRNVIGFLRFRN